ncbi:MAG: hypothetical protein AAF500_18525 [Myxococcota bacterium]
MKTTNAMQPTTKPTTKRTPVCAALALVAVSATLGSPTVTLAQGFSCETRTEQSIPCTVTRLGAVVCRTSSDSGAIDLGEVAACVDLNFSIGTNPVVTLAAFGGGSEPTDQYGEWNGGSALTTWKLEALKYELGDRPLYYEVAYPLLERTRGIPYPGQATVVTTRPIRRAGELTRMRGRTTVLVAGGGGAHGRVIAGDATPDVGRGGVGGNVDGWDGLPCPYADGVCADGANGSSAKGAPGGEGGYERWSPSFVSVAANGVEDSFAERFAWGGHGGGGHPHGGGGQALEKLTRMSAGGGGGGGSFAWRSTRPTPEGLQALLLREPGVQLIFQRDGLHSQVEWQYAEFSGNQTQPYELEARDAQTSLSITIDDPGGAESDLALGGLILTDGCGEDSQQIEPYRVTRLMNLGTGFTTTDDSKVFYRVYDGHGRLIRTVETRAAAAFVLDRSLSLFFAHTDRLGNRGKMSIFANTEPRLHVATSCPRVAPRG